MATVVVTGASGFVGSAVCDALARRGHVAIAFRTPRIDPATSQPQSAREFVELQTVAASAHALVNAAGIAEATGSDRAAMIAANSILPGLLARMCAQLDMRFVHVSSAAVQGRRPVLDSTIETAPFSPYSESKALGESAALAYPTSIVYRPPGVHGAGRSVTASIATLARSPLSSVAGNGAAPSAQALIGNVADAIAFLATTDQSPPRLVAHASEGVTAWTLLEDLGGKSPHSIPPKVARALVALAGQMGAFRPSWAGQARRLEMLWFGQAQAGSWLTEAGWQAPLGREAWKDLGRELAEGARGKGRS